MQSIGRYELVEKLGQGGMGAVYRARDTLLERIVAVKVIATVIDQDAELRERFFREARAAGQLSHKNIITIHDLGEHEGQPYLAMEYLQGQDLLARMASPQRMSLRRRVEIATEICEGLEFAHAHGVVHRDIKPANIFITDSGSVKILDFGLARLVTSELTRSNMMMGTINYMAPEQIRGERVDHRADVFSTAVVVYELLSGRRAFEADSFAATLYKILQEVPEPLQQIDPSIPTELVRIVERGLAKPRDERYQQISEMHLDLALYRQQLGAMDSPAVGHLAPTELRTPSDRPFPLTPPMPIAGVTTPIPASGPQTPYPGAPASTPPAASGFRTFVLPAVAVLALAIAAVAMWKATRPPLAPEAPPRVSEQTAPPITEMMKGALSAFEAENYGAAERAADAVLARDPGNEGARQLRDRARRSAAQVTDGLSRARDLLAKGRYEEASRAAGEVVAVAPGNTEARQIMADGAARSRGRGADEARAQAGRAKAAARTAGAPRLASGAFSAAVAAQREAERLSSSGRAGDATIKFYEASGLFRSAEVAAQNETASREAVARGERAAAERASNDVPRDPPVATPPPPSQPAPAEPRETARVPTTAPLTPEALPSAPPVTAPNPPAVAPAPPSAPSAEAIAAARDAAIGEVLNRYKAAIESRNLEALKRVWPGLTRREQDALRTQFQQASRISVTIVDPHISASVDTATVTFVRQYQVQTVDDPAGKPLESESNATMDLRRVGNAWVIEGLRYQLRR